MSTPFAIVLALLAGGLLTFGATRATASVSKGPLFLRWMITVFVTYLVLISLPVLAGF
jgi:predicted benzoate:H+ symporter BenE